MSSGENSFEQVRVKTAELIRTRLFHPRKDNKQLISLGEEFADLWPTWLKDGDIEPAVNSWLKKLNLSHTGFWRGAGSGIPPYFAINAVLKRVDGGQFVFWDVLPSGIADRSGIKPADVLVAVDGNLIGENEPRFRLGKSYNFTVLRDGEEKIFAVELPGVGPKDRPHVAQNVNRTCGSTIDKRTTRHAGYEIVQRKRPLIGKASGWIKQTGEMRKTKLRGLLKVGWQFLMTAAAFNLWRLPKLLAAPIAATAGHHVAARVRGCGPSMTHRGRCKTSGQAVSG